jgi:hypothetical protein
MTLAAPWALWGLLLLAGPVLVHLLSRRQARRTPFPSLQLLRAVRLPPVARRTLDDRRLLLLRLVALGAAVLASARPAPRAAEAGTGSAIARVLVIDTSASMDRLAAGGGTARAVADRLADSLALASARVLRVPTAEPAGVLGAAATWLDRSGGGELVVLTDVQRGAIDASDVAALPARLGVRVIAVPLATPRAATGGITPRDSVVRVRVEPAGPEATGSEATAREATAREATAREATAREAALDVLRAVAPAFELVSAGDSVAPHLVVRLRTAANIPGTGGTPDASALRVMARVRDDAWLQERLTRVGASLPDVSMPDAPHDEAAMTAADAPPGWLVPARPLTLQLRDDLAEPASLALVAAAIDALHALEVVPLREQDPASLDAEAVDRLSRAPDSSAPRDVTASVTGAAADDAPAPAARWLWALALVLLGAEQWWRARLARAARPVDA